MINTQNKHNKQKVFITIKNGYLIRERIANGFYSCLRMPLNVVYSIQPTAEDLINTTQSEQMTIEEQTDLNINKVTHDKVRRSL